MSRKKAQMEYYITKRRKNVRCWHFWEKSGQNYGYQIDYLHFHNMMEIGVCYYGEGTIVLEDKEIPYDGGIYGRTKEFATTNSKKTVCALGMAVY